MQHTGAGSGNVSDFKLKQQEFFRKLREYGEEKSKYVKSWQKPLPQHWYNVRIGSSKAKLVAAINSRENILVVMLEVWDDKDLFEKIHSKSNEIEKKLGFKLNWDLRPDKKASLAEIRTEGSIEDEDSQDKLIGWMMDKIDAMSKVFPKYF